MTTIELRGGKQTNDPRLDWVYPGLEAHMPSLRYLARDIVDVTLPPRSYTWRCDTYLDQGNEGACVGFGLTHELLCAPQKIKGLDATFAREQVYWNSQRRDWWDGGAYPGAVPFMEGTSVLHATQVVHEMGYYTEYRWSLDVRDIVYTIGYKGPVVAGTDWWTGMFNTNEAGFIRATGQVEGGHGYLIKGVKINYLGPYEYGRRRTWEDVDWNLSYLLIHNSWNDQWGEGGCARISLTEYAKLIAGGEFMVATRVPTHKLAA